MPTFQQVKLFVRAVTSGRDTELQAERDTICGGCDQFSERAVRTVTGKFRIEGHCKACGCGAKNIADIYKGKHAWRDMTCPQLKWPGDAESAGISLHEANMLYGAREGLEYSIAILNHYASKDKPLRGTAELIFKAHHPAGPDEPFTSEDLHKVIAKLTFYHKVVQQYIDEARPLDAAIMAQVRGRPQANKPATPPTTPPAPAAKSCCSANRNGPTRIPKAPAAQVALLQGAGI